MAQPETAQRKPTHRTHRELGEELIRTFPETYQGQNPYLLGKKYEEKYPDEVFIAEGGGLLGSESWMSDFAETSGEVIGGMWDLGKGVAGDVVDIAALPQRRARESVSGGDSQNFPFMRSLVGLGQGVGADVFQQWARALGLDEETIGKVEASATPAEQRAGRDLIAQMQESTESYERERRPMQFVANVSPLMPKKALGKMARKAAALLPEQMEGGKMVENVEQALGYADPNNILSTLAKAGTEGVRRGGSLIERVTDPARKLVKRASTRGRSFVGERAEDIAGFATSTGTNAIRRLKEVAGSDPKTRNKIRAWRRMPQAELYTKLYTQFNNAVRKLKEKAQQSYAIAEDQLGPVLRKPLEEVKPQSVAEMKGQLLTIIDEYEGVVEKRPATAKREQTGLREGKSPIFSGTREVKDWPGGEGRDLPPAQLPVISEVVDKPSGYTVSFEDAGIIPSATELKGPIAREFERFLNLDDQAVTGMDIHRLRQQLDKTINNMSGGAGPDDITKGAFKVRTDLRSALANALETTYGDEYRNAMADYRRVAEMQRQMYDTFRLTGSAIDKRKVETILAEIANTYNQNPRQGLRPQLIQEFAEIAEIPDLEASVLGAVFNPSLPKGLASRSVVAENASMILGGMTGMGFSGGDPWAAGVGAIVGGMASQAAQQFLYSPRLFSEALMTFYDLPSLPSIPKATNLIKRINVNPRASKILRENLPLAVTLERIKNEAGIDAESILAEEEEDKPTMLKSLGKGAR